MANTNNPTGFRPVNELASSPYSGGTRIYTIPASDATAVGIGDPIKLVGTSSTVNGSIFADVAQAATGDTVAGIVVGVIPVTRDSTTYREASTLRQVEVADDPNILLEIQEDSVGGALAAADIGQNANFVAGSASTTTGYSGFQLDSSTKATTNTLDLKIVGFVDSGDNAIGANAKWLVRLNKHQYVNQTAGV